MTTTEAQTPFTVGHRTVSRVAGPLIVVDGMDGVGYGELVEVETGDGPSREGQVLELDGSTAIVQVFGGTVGIGRRETSVLTRGRAARTGVGTDYFGRVLDGAGRVRDGGPQPVPDDYRHVNGLPLNPITRAHPDQFIETGVSAIDGLITLRSCRSSPAPGSPRTASPPGSRPRHAYPATTPRSSSSSPPWVSPAGRRSSSAPSS